MKRHSVLRFLLRPLTWWVAVLLVLIGGGLYAAFRVFTEGLVVTNLTDLVPWGLWITIDLSAIALSAGAFLLSATVYLLGKKEYEPVARTAVFVGLIGYSMACMMLLLDIGRPDRFWHGFVFWNIHSPLWEVTMCVGLYFSVLALEVLPLLGRFRWLQRRAPWLTHQLHKVHRLAPILAIAGLGFSMLHQSSLGATYGILKARPFWYQPGLAVMFMASAIVGGPALTILLSSLAARLKPQVANIDSDLLARLSRFVGWALVVLLYMRLWDVLSTNYTYEPGRSEALRLLTTGPLAFNFWLGEIALGMALPAILLLATPFKRHDGLRLLALALAAAGVVAFRWDTNMAGQLVVVGQTPHVLAPLYTLYRPSLVEIMAAAGVIAYGLLAFTFGVVQLRIVDHAGAAERVPEPAEAVSRPPRPAAPVAS